MFNTYPLAATVDNWVHTSIMSALHTIVDNIENGIPYPIWPQIIPLVYRPDFNRKTKIRNLFSDFYGQASAATVSSADRQLFLNVLNQQNQIPDLLNGTVAPPRIAASIITLYDKASEIFAEGFLLLGKMKLRDSHYKIIYDSLPVKTCPFCGYAPLDAPGLPREDNDHYLLSSIYPMAAANFMNLVPMCGRCNSSYKLTKDMIRNSSGYRTAFNPYGGISADISLVNTNLFGGANSEPQWQVDLLPVCQETNTWNDVFSIEARIINTVLNPNYGLILDEINTWFIEKDVFNDATDFEVTAVLQRFTNYKAKHKEQGLGFLKNKIAEVIVNYYSSGYPPVIALVRNALRPR